MSNFKAYLDRRSQRSSKIITKVGDPDFDIKLQAAIRQQMQDYETNSESETAI